MEAGLLRGLVGPGAAGAASAGYAEPSGGAAHGGEGAFEVLVGGCGGYALLGAREGGFGAFQVYLVCMFRGVGKDRYLVADYFHEASAYRHVRLFAIARYADFARAKGGEQRRVAGQDAKLARAAGGDERADFL